MEEHSAKKQKLLGIAIPASWRSKNNQKGGEAKWA